MVEGKSKTEDAAKKVGASKKAFPQEEFQRIRELLPFSGIDFEIRKSHLPDRLSGELRQLLEGWEFSPMCGMVRVVDSPIGTAETVLNILSGQIACDVDCVHEDSRDNIEDAMNAWRAMADAALREVRDARKKLAGDGLVMLVATQRGESKRSTQPIDADDSSEPDVNEDDSQTEIGESVTKSESQATRSPATLSAADQVAAACYILGDVTLPELGTEDAISAGTLSQQTRTLLDYAVEKLAEHGDVRQLADAIKALSPESKQDETAGAPDTSETAKVSQNDQGERVKLEVGMRVEAIANEEYFDGVVVELSENGCWVRSDDEEPGVVASPYDKVSIHPLQAAGVA